MPQSHPTLDQQRTNAAFSGSRSGPPVGAREGKHLRGAYTNAAKKLWSLSDDWEVNLLMNIFGPERMGSIAAAFDPLAKFRVGGQQVDIVRRRRIRGTHSVYGGFTAIVNTEIYANYVINPDNSTTIVAEYQAAVQGPEDISEEISGANGTRTTFSEDSTDRLRAKGCRYSEYRASEPHEMNWTAPPTSTFTTIKDETHEQLGGRYVRYVITTVFSYYGDAPVVLFVDNVGNDGRMEFQENYVREWCASHLEDVLPPCLSSFRLFNAFYQIGELKDLPMMIRKTFATADFLRGLTRNSKTGLQRVDKVSADTYLNNEFGYESIEQTFKSLAKLPEKVSKRFNYLLEKNSKVTSQRFKKAYKGPSQLSQLAPWWSYRVPVQTYYDVIDEIYDFDPEGEIRCVVNGIVDFPRLAVPKFSDSTYRDMIGLNPRLVDLYNLVPWTWLGDWFSGVSKYLNLVETVALDETLVNVGFITALVSSKFRIRGKVRIWQNYQARYNRFGHLISETKLDPVDIPYDTSGSMKYRTRFSIDELPSVKSVLDKQGLLSEEQKLTLGALLTKFT